MSQKTSTSANSNPHNKWFVLCSEDVFPLKTYEEFEDYLGKQTKSLFSRMQTDSPKTTDNFKTQQWWALTRNDVELLMNELNISAYTGATGIAFTSHIRRQPLFMDIQTTIPKKAAMDELFFFSCIQKNHTNIFVH